MKLTTKQLKQIIKEELQIFENEEEFKDFYTDDGRDMASNEALKKVASMIASGPDQALMAQEILQSLGYDVKIKISRDGTAGDFYSDNLGVLEIIDGALNEMEGVVEMSKPELNKFGGGCKTTWKYLAYIYFTE